MAYLKPDQYKGASTKFPFPSQEIDPKKKKELNYYLAQVQAMYSDYMSNHCAIPFEFGLKRSIRELRMYAKGQQSSDKIKSWVLGKRKKNNDGTYITKMNVSWDSYAKLPQMFDIMRSRNMSQEYDVALTCVDENSIAAAESTRGMMKFLIADNTRKFLEKAQYKPNFQPDPNQLGLQNEEDVDMYMDTGGFSLQWQIAAQAACNKSKIASNYKMFQDAIFDDLIINPEGICGARTYIEKSTKIPKFRRLNMEKVGMPYSDLANFGDITWAFEIRVMTIAEIRKENPNLSSAELLTLAKNFRWMNPGYANVIDQDGFYGAHRNGVNQSYDIDPVSRVKVLVMDSQWLSVDIETNVKNQERKFFQTVDFDYKITAKDLKKGDQLLKRKVIRKYEAEWIIGTECFLKCGVCDDTVYYGEDGNKTPKLDFHFAKTGNASLVERCVAIVDDMDLILVKNRNAWATLPAAPAMAIQKDLIENVFLNGILQQPEDIMQTLIERGILYYNGLDDHGKPLYMAGGQKPIDYMDVSRMTQMLSVCSIELAAKVNELREVLGLQGGADAGEKSPYQGLGETELAFQAANASLQPTFNAYNYLFKDVFTDIIKKWQIVAKDKPVKVSYSVLGTKNLTILELSKNFTLAEFNVDVTIAPTNEEKQAILQDLVNLKALNVQTQGSQGLTTSEYMYIYEKVMAGNIKEAYFVMGKIEAKKRAALRQQQLEDQEANIQSQQESARVKGEMDRQNLELKNKGQIDNSLVSALLKQNQAMLEALVAPKKEGEAAANEALALSVINQNTEDVTDVVMEGDSVSEQPETAPAEQEQAEVPM